LKTCATFGNGALEIALRVVTAQKKKKSLLPRRTWKINPLTKVKTSDKVYKRREAKKSLDDSNE